MDNAIGWLAVIVILPLALTILWGLYEFKDNYDDD